MSTLKNITSIYKNYAKYPTLNSANFLSNSNPYAINSLWTINDLASCKSKTININYQNDYDKRTILKSSPLMRDEEVIIDIYSQCFKFRAICLERKNPESVTKDKINLIHLWSDDIFLKSINLSDLNIHGSVYKRGFNFGNFQWLESGKKLIYIANAKKIKKLSYFQYTSAENSKTVEIGNQYLYKRTFGEQLEYVDNPVICILDVDEETIEVFNKDLLCPNNTIGVFCVRPNGEGFVFTAYKDMPYNLGLIYCTQRCCDLFYYDLVSKIVTKLGDENKSKISPRFSPDGYSVIWLENEVNGPHMQCQRLMKYDFITNDTNVIIDIVREPNNSFPGIYNLGLINNCWSHDSKHVFLTTQYYCQSKIIAVDILSANVTILNRSEAITSETLLDANERFLLIKYSSPSTVPYLAMVDIQSAMLESKLSLVPISSVHTLDNILSCKILDHVPDFPHPKYGKSIYQSIYIESNKDGPRPLILMLHGGPHSAFNTEFSYFVAAIAELGYSALMVNYRGSIGYGEESLESLLGYIGDIDVSDCVKACEDLISNFPLKINSENIFLYGGSHGGFLGLQLAAKYGHRVKAFSCRNGVFNIPSMITSTDIPDWTYTECGYTWNYDNLLTAEQLGNIYKKSPITLVNHIKCPILINIGMEDQRVPPSQGIELHKALLARSIRTELYEYPNDSHPLSSVEASSDCFVNTMLWFNDNLQTEILP